MCQARMMVDKSLSGNAKHCYAVFLPHVSPIGRLFVVESGFALRHVSDPNAMRHATSLPPHARCATAASTNKVDQKGPGKDLSPSHTAPITALTGRLSALGT
jgi:hypothetical protein